MSALESSITLDDVFAVVEGKRVPLAPELAGYLTLEIADGAEAAGGTVDPRAVYISEAGTVALVRPVKDGPPGDAETSVRAILAQLLEASGSATPALAASARRAAGAGLTALVGELEAALIPVNRAAGRRALARLAREVKRVTLSVGRNASMPPPAKAAPPTAPVEIVEAPTLVRGAAGTPPPPQVAPLSPPPYGQPDLGPTSTPARRGGAPDTLFKGDEVDSLLSTFEVSGRNEDQVRAELKALVGLGPTPRPPDAATLADLTKDVGRHIPLREREDDSVESLLALGGTTAPLPPPLPVEEAPPLAPLVPLVPPKPRPGPPQAAPGGERAAVPAAAASLCSHRARPVSRPRMSRQHGSRRRSDVRQTSTRRAHHAPDAPSSCSWWSHLQPVAPRYGSSAPAILRVTRAPHRARRSPLLRQPPR